MFKTKETVILASSSPRRQMYFRELGIDFKVSVAAVNEDTLGFEDPRSYVTRVARKKAVKVMDNYPSSWVVSADTTVSLDGQILGKPKDFEEAVGTLMLLSGRIHEVATAFCLGSLQENIFYQEIVITRVTFISFLEDIAQAYASTGEWKDKAGAYGIQGRGSVLVSEIKGSYTNVVGLPLSQLVAAMLKYEILTI